MTVFLACIFFFRMLLLLDFKNICVWPVTDFIKINLHLTCRPNFIKDFGIGF
jgi:hypothetical protein